MATVIIGAAVFAALGAALWGTVKRAKNGGCGCGCGCCGKNCAAKHLTPKE